MNPILKWLCEEGQKRDKNPSPKDRKAYLVRHGIISLPEGLENDLNVSYETEEGRYLKADVIMPKDSGERKLPIIVMIHGGAFLFGNRKLNLPFRIMMAKRGYLVYSLEYRLLNETDFFGALSDINHGLQYVKDSSVKYNGDPERIYIVGESAGGLLALYSAASIGSEAVRDQFGVFCPDIKVSGLVISSGMLYTTRADYIRAVYKKDLYGKRAKDKEFIKYMNPEYPEIVSSIPKICLVSGYGDFLRKLTLRYAKALEKANHPSLLLYYDYGKKLPHAFMTVFPSYKESRDAIKKMHEWIISD